MAEINDRKHADLIAAVAEINDRKQADLIAAVAEINDRKQADLIAAVDNDLFMNLCISCLGVSSVRANVKDHSSHFSGVDTELISVLVVLTCKTLNWVTKPQTLLLLSMEVSQTCLLRFSMPFSSLFSLS